MSVYARQERSFTEGCFRAILCVLFPPLAVVDRGCGTVLIVFALTLAGWVPGALAALILNYLAADGRI
jgi:uncharacterized membrane protein YqaE (UPF0057 family)